MKPAPAKSRTNPPVTVGSAYAKANFGELLKKVKKGQAVTIERYNKPVAILSPPPRSERPIPKLGTIEGARILDPDWADPMTEEQVDEMLKDRY